MATNFLTPAEIKESLNLLKDYDYTISGGFDEAERRIIIVGEENANISEYIDVLKIESNDGNLNHRSVLGSILALGLERDVTGDILIKEKVCNVFVLKEISEFIINNLNRIGHDTVHVSRIGFDNLIKFDDNIKEKFLNIASLRLDALVSAAFNLSREKSAELIEHEKVLINFLPCVNTSKKLKEHDLISVRGHGRVRFIEVIGETRSGRCRIKAEVF